MPEWIGKLSEWLREMLAGGDTTIRDNDLHISKTKDGSKFVIKNSGSGSINVQQINVAANHHEDLVRLLKEQAFEKDAIFIQDDSRKILTSVDEFERSAAVREVIDFFSDKIPNRDIMILRSGLYIKHLRSIGDPTGQRIKADIVARYGHYGKNIVNLTTAGYFESYIRPLHEQMSKQEGFTNDDFLKEYRLIVSDLPFAVFVNAGMTPEVVVSEVREKADAQLKYDVAEDVISIHGYGSNTEIVAEAKELLGEDYEVAEESYFSGIKITIVKVYYRRPRYRP